MTRARGDLGLWGEAEAARHLEAKGFRVLARRLRTKFGELDLVAEDQGTLVFVEVKAGRKVRPGSHPAENVHGPKRRRLIRAAAAYVADLPVLPACRFDVVTVRDGDALSVEHFEGAFGG